MRNVPHALAAHLEGLRTQKLAMQVKEEALRILAWLVVEVLAQLFDYITLANSDLGLEFLGLVLSVLPHANRGLRGLPLEGLPSLAAAAAKRPAVELARQP